MGIFNTPGFFQPVQQFNPGPFQGTGLNPQSMGVPSVIPNAATSFLGLGGGASVLPVGFPGLPVLGQGQGFAYWPNPFAGISNFMPNHNETNLLLAQLGIGWGVNLMPQPQYTPWWALLGQLQGGAAAQTQNNFLGAPGGLGGFAGTQQGFGGFGGFMV